MAEPPFSEFGKLFEGALKEADLEQIRALVLENNSPEVAGEVARLLHQYSAVLDVAGRFASETSLDVLLPQVGMSRSMLKSLGRCRSPGAVRLRVLQTQKGERHHGK